MRERSPWLRVDGLKVFEEAVEQRSRYVDTVRKVAGARMLKTSKPDGACSSWKQEVGHPLGEMEEVMGRWQRVKRAVLGPEESCADRFVSTQLRPDTIS